jgi:hypothetical protein
MKKLAVAALLLVSACGPTMKYDWKGYSSTLYDYYRDPTASPEYVKELDKIIAAEGKGHKVPPGVFAEAGYMAMAKGDTGRAVDLFEREKKAWPEAGVFMDKAIATARGGGKAAPEPARAIPASATPTS